MRDAATTALQPLQPQKDELDAPYFQLRLSDKKGAEYTAEARLEIDCTMDGEVYRDMMAGRTNADEGILDDIAAYFDRHGRKRGERINLQEDGAPGAL